MIESLRNLDLIKAIDEKMNFPERRKAGTTQAHCLVILANSKIIDSLMNSF